MRISLLFPTSVLQGSGSCFVFNIKEKNRQNVCGTCSACFTANGSKSTALSFGMRNAPTATAPLLLRFYFNSSNQRFFCAQVT